MHKAFYGPSFYLEDEYGISSKIRVKVNKDASVDGEVRFTIPKGINLRDVLLLAENAMKVPRGQWLSVGFVHDISGLSAEVMKRYLRYRGKARTQAYWSRSAKKALHFLTARRIARNIARKRRRKPEQVIIKLHWNPWREKPLGSKIRKR